MTDTGIVTGFDIGDMVADEHAASEIKIEVVRCLQQHARRGLAAITRTPVRRRSDVGVVRTIIDCIDACSLVCQQGMELGVNVMKTRLRQQSARDCRLICHHDQRDSRAVNLCDRRRDSGDEHDLIGPVEVIDHFDYDAIPINEYRGSLHSGRFVRHVIGSVMPRSPRTRPYLDLAHREKLREETL